MDMFLKQQAAQILWDKGWQLHDIERVLNIRFNVPRKEVTLSKYEFRRAA